jgi:hypothetical protein
MLRVAIKVSIPIITELIPGPLLSVMRDRGPLYLLLDPIGIRLLELKVPIRAGTGAHFIKGALIPNDIGLTNLLRSVLTVLIILKIPCHCCWWSFRLCVRDGPRRDQTTLELHPPLHMGTHIFRLLSQGEVIEVSSKV